jgi:CBS domain-containing protein
MNRRDAHFDAMLRHLGAAYYDSLHGRAAAADVARAVDSIADHMGEQPVHRPQAATASAGRKDSVPRRHHGRFHSRVRDVMTRSVVTVDRITPYKEIARTLAEHEISGVPVLTMGRHVAGVVSEGDLLAARDHNPMAGHGLKHRLASRKQHQPRTAEQLMTSPAVTTNPDATIAGAARLMNAHHVRRLPVVDPHGKLIGIVSRRDLLSVFLRPDDEIARQVGEILAELLPGGPAGIKVAVRNGVVILTGQLEPAAEEDLIPVAVRLAWDVDGVVDVVNKAGTATAGAPSTAVTS